MPKPNDTSDCTGRLCETRPDPIEIIEKYYTPGSPAHDYIIRHGKMVAELALEIADRVTWLPPGYLFIEEAAMLHDIGIFMTDAPHLGCTGDYPYIAHGYLGRQILDDEGCHLHALVCERHVGVGLSKADIAAKGLPVPARDMLPITLEEQIICFADKFFPVTPERMLTRQTRDEARRAVETFGATQLRKFDRWAVMFQQAE